MKYNFKNFTVKATEALNFAINSAEKLGHTYIGSEHILLGLAKVGSGIASTVLLKNGVTADKIEELIKKTEQGDSEAQFQLRLAHYKGNGKNKNTAPF